MSTPNTPNMTDGISLKDMAELMMSMKAELQSLKTGHVAQAAPVAPVQAATPAVTTVTSKSRGKTRTQSSVTGTATETLIGRPAKARAEKADKAEFNARDYFHLARVVRIGEVEVQNGDSTQLRAVEVGIINHPPDAKRESIDAEGNVKTTMLAQYNGNVVVTGMSRMAENHSPVWWRRLAEIAPAVVKYLDANKL